MENQKSLQNSGCHNSTHDISTKRLSKQIIWTTMKYI